MSLEPERSMLLATAISEAVNTVALLAFYSADLPMPREDLLRNLDVFFEVTGGEIPSRGAELIQVLRAGLVPVRAQLAAWTGGEIPVDLELSARTVLAELEPFGLSPGDSR